MQIQLPIITTSIKLGEYLSIFKFIFASLGRKGGGREIGRGGMKDGTGGEEGGEEGEGGEGGRVGGEGGRRGGEGEEGGREGERGWREEGPERRQSDRQHYVISRHQTSSGSF